MPDDVNPSPEEKLLRVIRSGGKSDASDKTTGEPAPAAPESAAPAPVVTQESAGGAAGDKSATVADGPATATEPSAATVLPEAETGAKVPATDSESSKPSLPAARPALSMPQGGGAGRRHWLTAVSRGLTAAALLLLAFAVWDGWGYFSEIQHAAPVLPSLPVADAAAEEAATTHRSVEEAGLPPLDDLLSRFRERPLFALAAAVETAPRRTEPTAAPRSDWERYAGAHLTLLGLSVVDAEAGLVEAIVADANTGAMHYLQNDDPLLLDGVRVSVEAVKRDALVLTDGSRRVEIK